MWLRLSRRERQVMDVVYRLGRARAADVQAEIPDPPSYSAVRSALSILVEKGHLTFDREGRSYVYEPAVPAMRARADAARRLLATFFRGDVPLAVAELLSASDRELTDDDLDAIDALVARSRRGRAGDDPSSS